MKGIVTRVVRSPHCPEGRMYMVNEVLLALPNEDDPAKLGICLVVWDDDEIVKQASTLIGEHIEIE